MVKPIVTEELATLMLRRLIEYRAATASYGCFSLGDSPFAGP